MVNEDILSEEDEPIVKKTTDIVNSTMDTWSVMFGRGYSIRLVVDMRANEASIRPKNEGSDDPCSFSRNILPTRCRELGRCGFNVARGAR